MTKKFKGVDGTVEDVRVSEDFEAADRFDNVKIGKLGAYFRDGFQVRFVPFEYIERAFIRIQEVNGKLCCGNAVFTYFRLVFVHDGKEFADTLTENETAVRAALDAIAARSANTRIGVERND